MTTHSTKNAVFRDNVFPGRLIDVSQRVRDVIDTSVFQRLRGVRQLGLASYVFPSGEHSRFVHSIGAYGTARLAFATLQARANVDLPLPGTRFDAESEAEFTLAALCHDIGHTAFSHVLEGTLLPAPHRHHESMTAELIQDNPELHQALERIADIDAILLMLNGTHGNNALSRLVSGPFDVDRCDYLLRDSAMTGVEYGKFDLVWLIHSLSVQVNARRQPVLVLDGPKGLDAMRQFVAARRDMHRHVYFHPTIQAAQLHLKAIFNRLQDRPDKRLKPLLPRVFHGLVYSNKVSAGEFLDTTDAEVLAMIRSLASSAKDPLLAFLCSSFVQRRFPKCVLDSGRMHAHIGRLLNIDISETSLDEEKIPLQSDLFNSPLVRYKLDAFLVECRDFVRRKEKAMEWPQGLADYFVTVEPRKYAPVHLDDFGFSFNSAVMPFKVIDSPFSEIMRATMKDFDLFRLFAPEEVRNDLAAYIRDRFELEPTGTRHED